METLLRCSYEADMKTTLVQQMSAVSQPGGGSLAGLCPLSSAGAAADRLAASVSRDAECRSVRIENYYLY